MPQVFYKGVDISVLKAAQWGLRLKALAALQIPSTHMASHSHLQLSVTPVADDEMLSSDLFRQTTYIHKINYK